MYSAKDVQVFNIINNIKIITNFLNFIILFTFDSVIS